MKKRIAMLLACCLLAGCAAPAEPVSTPEAPTPTAAVPAETLSAPVPTPTPEPVPTPDRGDLTEEQVEQVNRSFSWRENPEHDADFMAVSGFFTSYYDDVRELDFLEFLWYYPSEYGVGEEEFAALAELPGFPWKKEYFAESGLTPSRLPVPTCRIPRSSVDETLQKYAGITTADLKNTDNTLYLPEYDAYYTFTSDFGPGSFTCEGGRVTEDTAVLWSRELYGEGIRHELTLKKEREAWHIRSFLRIPVDRGASLDADLLGLDTGEIKEISDVWGFGKLPTAERAAELARQAAQNPAYRWDYEDGDLVERTVWEMTVTLADGRKLDFGAGVHEDIVRVADSAQPERASYFRAPELYWTLRREYDSGGGGTIDREALEKYRTAVDSYLSGQMFAPEVRAELTAFTLVQENTALNAQVWSIGTALTTDPPELAPRMVGNGYVDSKLRMHPITSEGADDLLVTLGDEVLGFRNWAWLKEGGLDRCATAEELREDMS